MANEIENMNSSKISIYRIAISIGFWVKKEEEDKKTTKNTSISIIIIAKLFVVMYCTIYFASYVINVNPLWFMGAFCWTQIFARI